MKILKLRKLLALISVTLVVSSAMIPTKASAAWKQSDNGNWSYTEGDSSVSGWKSIDGKWYFFNSNRIMKTGWILDGSTWYYLAPSGAMKTGWINDGGKWYYATPSGAMQTGWIFNNYSWYYLSPSGDMKTGLVDVDNKTYYLSESGAMKTGNITFNGVSYAFAASGEEINSSTASDTTTSQSATTNNTSSNSTSSGGSGGSGGGGGSSSSSDTDDDTESYYESLYGTWTIGDYIPSKIDDSLSESELELYKGFAIGEQFTVEDDKITSDFYGTIDDPSIKEETMTASEFKSKYKDTFENVGIPGEEVKYIRISGSGHSVTVFIDEDDNVYALAKNMLFHLE